MEFRLIVMCPKEVVWDTELGYSGKYHFWKIGVMGLVEQYLTWTLQEQKPTNHTYHRA